MTRYFILISSVLLTSDFTRANGVVTKVVPLTKVDNKINIPKCCPLGEYIVGFNQACEKVADRFKHLSLDFNDVPLKTSFEDLELTGRKLPDIYTVLPVGILKNATFNNSVYDYASIGHRHHLTENGMLYEEVLNEYTRWYPIDIDSFCVDYKLTKNMLRVIPRFLTKMVQPMPPAVDERFITAGLLISCVFLTLVLVVYSLLPELRNLGGLVLMAYVASLLCGFLLLVNIQITQHSRLMCRLLTYSIYFSLLASFFWMNVMSVDIWWTFRGYAKARPIHRRGERCKFLIYCLYAFGIPLAMTVMLIVLDHVNMRHVPWFITPKVLKRGCFIPEEPKFFYLYIPMLVLILSNWVFFLLTAFNIWRLHRSTSMLDSAAAGNPAAHRNQRYRLMLYLKLSIIMGVNWVLEAISSFLPQFKGWYISDAYNMLIGVSIFLIFVCKKKILKMLVKRFRSCEELRRRRSSSYSKSRSTSSNTTESEITQETPLQMVCSNPKGPGLLEKR